MSDKQTLDNCEHDQLVRVELADGSQDWQCVNCGATFEVTLVGKGVA